MGPDYFSPRINRAAIEDTYAPTARVRGVLNHWPHEDAEPGEDWIVFNSDGAVSPSSEMTACVFFNAAPPVLLPF
jgi:hypothetical protein